MNAELLVGADAGGTMIKYVVMSRSGKRLHQGEVATDPEDAADSLGRLAVAIQRELPAGAGTVTAVGLACAGIVSVEQGTIGRSPNLPGLENCDLGRALQQAFPGCQGVVANDVNAALFGEYRLGAGRCCADLVMIALGTGVGGGVLLDGKLVTGTWAGAGEIGHMVLDPDGPTCGCGNHGCLEAYAGSSALLNRARELTDRDEGGTPAFRELVRQAGSDLTTAALCRLAQEGDRAAVDLFTWAGRRLGQAVGNVVNLLDPEKVIIGGGVSLAGELILAPCRRQAAGQILSEASRAVPIVTAELGPHAAALGAALLARRKGAGR